jgi:hypothetical protein
MVKYIPFLLLIVMTAATSFADTRIQSRELYSINGMSYRKITVAGDPSGRQMNVIVINDNIPNPKKVIWLFHGYKPAGDPYRQSPKIFVENWSLISLCKKMDYICIAPDMGKSVYPISTLNDDARLSDLRFLRELHNELVFNAHRNVPVTLIGISTGVEGTIKFATLIENVESIIALSGTYDFFALPENSGEYLIHEKTFGKERSVWLAENPREILRRSVRMKIHLFCESNSIYLSQAKDLIDQKMTNLDIDDRLFLGAGFSHNWNFWGNRKVIDAIREILIGRFTK